MSELSEAQQHMLSLIDEDKRTLEARGSEIEPPFAELSGDEAIEKSFASTLHSSMWKNSGKQNLFFSGITVMKTMVGVGILGLPNIFKNFGVLISIVILIFFSFSHSLSSYILLKSKNLSKHSNFSTIGYYIFKNRWIIIIINFIIISTNMGACLGELMYRIFQFNIESIFGTTVTNIVNQFMDGDEPPFYLKKEFLTVIIGILIFPLLIVKSIEKLKFVSLTAILAISSFSVLVVYNFIIQYLDTGLGEGVGFLLPTDFNFTSAFGALPTVILAFTWHFNLFPIYKGMKNPNDVNLMKANYLGIFQANILYMVVGILGYATYGNKVETDFLKIIDPNVVGKGLYIFLNVSFTVSTILTFPIIFFGARNNTIMIIKQIRGRGQVEKKKIKKSSVQREEETVEVEVEEQDVNEQEQKNLEHLRKKKEEKKKERVIFFMVVIGLITFLITAAITITSLETVFNFLGAIGCNFIVILFPTTFYTILSKTIRHRKYDKQKRWFYYFIKSYQLFGIVILLVCVSSEIIQVVK